MKRLIVAKTTLPDFKSRCLGKEFGRSTCNKVVTVNDYKYGKYFVAVDHTPSYGWSCLYVEDETGNPIGEDDDFVNIGAFGTTKSDFEDSLFYR